MPWKDKRKVRQYQKKYHKTHRNIILEYGLKYRQNNRESIKEQQRQHRFKLKLQAYDAYNGRKCAWCGENDIDVLNIDHIDNNSCKHLDSKGYKIHSSRMYTWLKKNNYPVGYQVLCFNCNYAKSFYGRLPENRKNINEKS